jgi:hypothetical protein
VVGVDRAPVIDVLASTSFITPGIAPSPMVACRYRAPKEGAHAELVDQVVLERRLEEARAVGDLDLGAVLALSAATHPATSPVISVELFHSTRSIVAEATCLRVLPELLRFLAQPPDSTPLDRSTSEL